MFSLHSKAPPHPKALALCGHTLKHGFGMTYTLKLIFRRNALRHIAYAVFIYEKIERQYALCLTARESGIFVVFVEHLFAEFYSFCFIKIGAVGYAVERKAAVEVFPLRHYLVHCVYSVKLRRKATPAFYFAV